jgi:hypothetical protein
VDSRRLPIHVEAAEGKTLDDVAMALDHDRAVGTGAIAEHKTET